MKYTGNTIRAPKIAGKNAPVVSIVICAGEIPFAAKPIIIEKKAIIWSNKGPQLNWLPRGYRVNASKNIRGGKKCIVVSTSLIWKTESSIAKPTTPLLKTVFTVSYTHLTLPTIYSV